MLISVCLPAYNGAEFIGSAVESVLGQSCSDFELLIADDCSQDNTFSLVSELAKDNDKIICWRNDQRLGLFENYNQCLQRSRGALIKPFAQDDLLRHDALAKMVAAFSEQPGIALVCADKLTIASDASDVNTAAPYAAAANDQVETKLSAGRVGGKIAALECLKSYRNLIGEPVAVLFDAKLKHLGFDSSYHSLGDLDLWLRLLERGDLYHLSEPLVQFRQHGASRSAALLQNMDWVLDFYRLSRQYEPYLQEIGISREQYCMRFTDLAGTLIDKLAGANRIALGDLEGYREVAYFSMRRCAELSFKSREYDAVVSSSSWRITEPLRQLMRQLEKFRVLPGARASRPHLSNGPPDPS